MSITFYYAPMSSASPIHWIIEELGVKCEKVKMDLKSGDLKKPEFMKLNPNAKVPVIVHDGTPIFESIAIAMHLGELFGVDKGMYPAQGPKRGEAMKWLVWTGVTLGETMSRYQRQTAEYFPADERNPKAFESAKRDLAALLSMWNNALEGKSYMLGESFSIVDAFMASWSEYFMYSGVDIKPYKALAAWSARCLERPVRKQLATSGEG